MYCSHCGAQIDNDAVVCIKCGCAVDPSFRSIKQQGLGREVSAGEEISTKSFAATAILCLFLGWMGIHRFYVGKTGTGLLMLFTFGGFGIWWLVDLIRIVTSDFTDSRGRRIPNVEM